MCKPLLFKLSCICTSLGTELTCREYTRSSVSGRKKQVPAAVSFGSSLLLLWLQRASFLSLLWLNLSLPQVLHPAFPLLRNVSIHRLKKVAETPDTFIASIMSAVNTNPVIGVVIIARHGDREGKSHLLSPLMDHEARENRQNTGSGRQHIHLCP